MPVTAPGAAAARASRQPPRRPDRQPPRHLADLDAAGRRAAAAELGERPFRADQLARHYFGRLTDDPADMTDLPAADRE
ncbi:MAG: 23S rRNA (adenine(2503)-C(2))-methyltransferase RlmN, partial [Actinobacteria bacterium]|nr:23S rRNA (adenine(2503)-C(2))-methyltransferase RlmN [Actinomycetota bacterium]